MPIRIVLTGSECTGKTTLADRLAQHYGSTTVPEFLRSYFEQKKGILSVDDVIPIAMGQLELETAAQERGDNPLICDTDIISSIVYAKHYFGACPDWLEEQFMRRTPSIYLLCDIDIQWQADGQRDMEHGRQYMQQLFADELKSRNLIVHTVSGSREHRFEFATNIINSAIKASVQQN